MQSSVSKKGSEYSVITTTKGTQSEMCTEGKHIYTDESRNCGWPVRSSKRKQHTEIDIQNFTLNTIYELSVN